MPQLVQTLLPLCYLRRWTSGCGGDSYPEEEQKPYSETYGYIKSRIAITLVWATHLCIWGYRVTAHKINVHQLQWKDGAGLNIFR